MQSRKRHAQYGTACSECSRIKSRCIATSPGSPCERGNFQVHQRPFLTLFTQLANTVVFDLGLNQPPQTIPEAMLRLTIHRPWLSATHTVEEQRAVIASYYLSSIVSSYMRRTDKLLWTPYMSTCLDDFSSTGVPGDLALVSMVKIRNVLEKAFYSPPNSNTSAPETPSDFVALVLKSELNELTTEDPCPAESPITSCHLTYASFAISEFALSSSSPDPQHLYNTYQALESYFNAFLPFQPSAYPGFTLAELYQMMHATLSLRKLSFRLTTRVYDEDRVEKLASWYRQVSQNLKDASKCSPQKKGGRAAVFGKLAGMLESFNSGDKERPERRYDNDFNMNGVGGEAFLGEEWLGLVDQFEWTF
ncbi:unnamed protein product [Colletotrichum noveboracense]|uniref:Zn(2)-C6 fungal-type domain-containing protein n=1 Tax=Colletotrichum noveboracense TaxID=2664923 RepID=A0A9W4RLD8_9PEZI|nr:unnamed protein product [Colletotrichum noveboracense]